MTTPVDTEPEVEVPSMEAPKPTLKVADRCDNGNCDAQAFVMTKHGKSFLLWCGHHFRDSEDVLKEFVVVDNRELLRAKPAV